jgi:flagellar FliL protein
VATKPDAAKPDADGAGKGAPKSKKMIVIVGVLVLVLALAGGGAWFVLSKKAAAAADEDAEEVAHVAPKGPPTFLPLDNMVVNLADPGGEKVAQIGITLELIDVKAGEKVKVYLPAIRSGILLLISQRTAEELLLIEGKEKLAADILEESLRPFGAAHAAGGAEKKVAAKAKKKNAEEGPVRAVHFSSFIVQ